MSYTLKYYPDPGIAFDISKMLFVKLNPPSIWHSSLTTLDSQTNEIQYIQNQADSLPAPPSELLLFVYLPTNKRSTLLTTTIYKLIYKEFSTFSISALIDYFTNTKQIQKDIFTYYLGDHPTDLDHAIRLNKNIPDKLKLLLFSFVLNPTPYISLLCSIIKKYYDIITERHLSDASHNFVPSAFINYIIEKTYASEKQHFTNFFNNTIAFSLCYSTPDFLLRNFLIDTPFFITTRTTISYILDSAETSITSSLINSTTALCDKSRLAIISHIISNPQLTLKQIAQTLHLPESTIVHHLSLLKKANIISSIRHGRTVLYSYNPQGFQNIITALTKLEKGGNIK